MNGGGRLTAGMTVAMDGCSLLSAQLHPNDARMGIALSFPYGYIIRCADEGSALFFFYTHTWMCNEPQSLPLSLWLSLFVFARFTDSH